MEHRSIYEQIAGRTDGTVYIGVVGPVRTGKSTFIKRFMEQLVLPNIENVYERERATDELPQSGSGRTIMTAEPKFVPNEAARISPDGKTTLQVRLIDSVGYMIPGAVGDTEDGKPRMVTTPWASEELPMAQAAELGTKKVMEDHSSIGVVVTTDGTVTDIPREDYREAEARAEAMRIEAQAQAEAKRVEAQAEADAIRAKGMAEAEAIKAKGIAEAEAKDKLAEAMKKYGDAAVVEMVVQRLPEIMSAVARPMENIDKITVWDSMNGEGGSPTTANFLSGMMSERNNGASISEISGIYLGGFMKNVMRVFSVVLLIMVGTVFAVGPAGLIVTLFKNGGSTGVVTTTLFWLVIVLVYYFIATFISIDKIIGKIYPLFGICLIIMAVGVAVGIFVKPEYTIPEIWDHFGSMHPKGTPVWSFMFITVACGAISGFHSTQSPLMARCMKSEKQGRFVFYGAMVSEGVIALVWAAAGCALYEVTGGLNTGLAEILANGQSAAIYDVCIKTMGKVGVALAMLGVIACPITSGDTAFRSARLVLADWFKVDQKKWKNRLLLCVPVLGVGAVLGVGNALGFIDYSVIWRYFSWTNQTLAMIVLWAASMYLFYEKKNYWITAVPATFMSAVSATYFLLGNECLGQFINHKTAEGAAVYNTAVAYPIGIAVAVLFLGIFLYTIKKRHTQPHYETLGK